MGLGWSAAAADATTARVFDIEIPRAAVGGGGDGDDGGGADDAVRRRAALLRAAGYEVVRCLGGGAANEAGSAPGAHLFEVRAAAAGSDAGVGRGGPDTPEVGGGRGSASEAGVGRVAWIAKVGDLVRECRMYALLRHGSSARGAPGFAQLPTASPATVRCGDECAVIVERYTRTLADVAASELCTADVFRAAATMVDALELFHDLTGSVHGDLAPPNVCLDADDKPHLIDLDCRYRLYESESTLHGVPLGEPQYTLGFYRRLYCPISAHDDSNICCRTDDLESLAYLLLQIVCDGALPWSREMPDDEVLRLKEELLRSALDDASFVGCAGVDKSVVVCPLFKLLWAFDGSPERTPYEAFRGYLLSVAARDGGVG